MGICGGNAQITGRVIFLAMLRNEIVCEKAEPRKPVLHLLLRDVELFGEKSLQNILDAGCRSFYGEFRSLADYRKAAESVHGVDAEFVAVLPRVIKPGDTTTVKKILNARPDEILARNLEEVFLGVERQIPVIADFSFNVTNDFSFRQLLDWGVARITPGPDLDDKHLAALAERVPAEKMEQILVGRIPLFTAEHCFWRANIVKPGKPCERICQRQRLKLRDRYGAVHGIRSDIFCRMIVENSEIIETAPQARCRHFRVEWDERLGDATPEQTVRRIFAPLVFQGQTD